MVKRTAIAPLIIAAAIGLLPGCSKAQPARASAQPVTAEKKVLIVYLSRTSNTKAIAELIHQKTGGTIVALELERPYPADYDAIVQQVARENESGYLPRLKTTIDRIEQYDVVFVGFPTWGMRLPAADEELSAPVQPERKDRRPIQHERWIRARE